MPASPICLEILEFLPASLEEARGKTKFGGQPDWIFPAAWPVGRETGEPMVFLAQIQLRDVFPLDGLVYLFATHAYDPNDFMAEIDAMEWDAGENAAVVQLGSGQSTGPQGPPSFDDSGEHLVFLPRYQAIVDEPFTSSDHDLDSEQFEKATRYKVGGTPYFMVEDPSFYLDGGWHLLLQVFVDFVPLKWAFGDSPTLYCLIRDDFSEARMLMQEV